MAALGRIQVERYTIEYWKYTWKVKLPTGGIIWGSSYDELTEVYARKIVDNLMKVYNAGKIEQCNIIKKALQIKG